MRQKREITLSLFINFPTDHALDHVLASGENVNILVLDTEIYSNTGGQASKASQFGQTAKFATSGKKVRKKDLGMISMTYGYIYVASVAMGANHDQLVKAMTEAEKYNGPSLIIAYAPCINHGIDMSHSQNEEKLAVEAGYWPLYRFNPELRKEGKNPFQLDTARNRHAIRRNSLTEKSASNHSPNSSRTKLRNFTLCSRLTSKTVTRDLKSSTTTIFFNSTPQPLTAAHLLQGSP